MIFVPVPHRTRHFTQVKLNQPFQLGEAQASQEFETSGHKYPASRCTYYVYVCDNAYINAFNITVASVYVHI